MSEFNISIPGGQSKRLLTGGKYCPADILVTAEGTAGVGYSEITVTTNLTNALRVYEFLSKLIPSGAKAAMFYRDNKENTVNNQLISAYLDLRADVSDANQIMAYARWRDNELNMQHSVTAEFDLIVSPGNVYRMVVLL